MLTGGISLLHLGLHPVPSSRGYHVELFDERDGSLLRETDRGAVLARAPVLSLVSQGAFSSAEGMTEAFDASGRRLLITHQGTLRAASAGPGHGTCFSVWLPRAGSGGDAA